MRKAAADARSESKLLVAAMQDLKQNDLEGNITIGLNKDSSLSYLLIQTGTMKQLAEKFCDVLFIDGVYKVNIEGFPLYTVLCEDGTGRGRAVCYMFVENESKEVLNSAFTEFISLNSFVQGRCIVVVVEKDFNEISILKALLPKAALLLCIFHVLQAFQRKINKLHFLVKEELFKYAKKFVYFLTELQYNDCISRVKEISKEFYEYYMENWLSCKEMWVPCFQENVPHMGNRTNNRIERHNLEIKTCLKPHGPLK